MADGVGFAATAYLKASRTASRLTTADDRLFPDTGLQDRGKQFTCSVKILPDNAFPLSRITVRFACSPSCAEPLLRGGLLSRQCALKSSYRVLDCPRLGFGCAGDGRCATECAKILLSLGQDIAFSIFMQSSPRRENLSHACSGYSQASYVRKRLHRVICFRKAVVQLLRINQTNGAAL